MARYEECVGKLKPYLKQCGYVIKKDVKFIPISGLSGDNVQKIVSPEKCNWWQKCYTEGTHNTSTPTLLSTLDALSLTGRNATAPLRIPCLDRYLERGCVVLGKVESGTLRMGDEVQISPTKKKAIVEGIYIGESKVRSAKPGENVLIKFNINLDDVQKGYVLCHPNNVCPAVVEVRVQLALIDMVEHRPLFTQGKVTHSLTLTHSLLLTHLLTHSLLLTYSLTYSLTHLLTYSLTHSLTHSLYSRL